MTLHVVRVALDMSECAGKELQHRIRLVQMELSVQNVCKKLVTMESKVKKGKADYRPNIDKMSYSVLKKKQQLAETFFLKGGLEGLSAIEL